MNYSPGLLAFHPREELNAAGTPAAARSPGEAFAADAARKGSAQQ